MRDRKFSKYADRSLLFMVGGSQDDPELEWIHYDDIVRRTQEHLRETGKFWTHHKFVRDFGLDAELEQRCWYTGMQLYFVSWDFYYQDLGGKAPWRCSRDHLIPLRGEDVGGHPQREMVAPAGEFLNKTLGHIPFALRVLHRRILRTIEVDRDCPTFANVRPFTDSIIDTQNRFKVEGRYPWQPETYEEGSRGRRMSKAFMVTMKALEREYMALDVRARRDWEKNCPLLS